MFVWDITQSGLNENMRDEIISFSSNGQAMNTVFGLTTTRNDGIATISDISFYTRNDLVTRYPEMQPYLGAPDNGTSPTPLPQTDNIYTLSGTKVSSKSTLPAGIYIINGVKKINR